MADLRPARDVPRGWLARALDSDVFYSFYTSPVTVAAAVITLLFFVTSFFAPWLAPHDTFDLASISLMDAELPPSWLEGGEERFLIGTDDQGRDLLSAIMYGMRLSLLVGFASVILSAVIGVALGLVSGYVGGTLDDVLMRIADVQLSFPAILIALLVDGIMKGLFPEETGELLAIFVVVLSIAVSTWPQYARTVRASTMVEKGKEYVQAVQVIGLPSWLSPMHTQDGSRTSPQG